MPTIRLVDANDWPEIGSAEWTDQPTGGVVMARVIVRRHADGRTVMYIDANPGEGPLVDGDLLPLETKELDDAIERFGELHDMPDWVVAKCIQSVRG
jgi:hypothetical protein